MRMTLAERMRVKTETTKSGCWEWLGAVNNCGYGVVTFRRNGKATTTSAHRKYWELTKGHIPEGMQVNHRCDNRLCINPDHMFLGSQLDNIHDMREKGRENFWGWNGGTRR